LIVIASKIENLMSVEYCIGIDLGTTNSVLAFAPMEESNAMVAVLPIPQLVAPGTVERRLSLPSFLWRTDTSDAALQVSGIRSSFGVCGEYARRIASEQPERVIAAAKSWLCHQDVDRQSPVLPWESEEPEAKISPVQATTAYLRPSKQAFLTIFFSSKNRKRPSTIGFILKGINGVHT